jgi:phosphoenolpyruvate carboxykinase (ATP)
MYHFLSGYTAKVAGTERGITEPVATFSTCFGAAFMTLCPTVYADLLKEKMETYGSKTYLVNSGWAGGPYGEGKRMSIGATRACIDAILDGSIEDAEFVKDPVFGFEVPKALHDVDPGLLNIKSSWAHPENYEKMERKLAEMYVKNFKKYEGKGSVDYTQYGPKL